MDGYNRNLGLQAESAALLVHPLKRSSFQNANSRFVKLEKVASLSVDASGDGPLVKVSKERAISLFALWKMPCVGL